MILKDDESKDVVEIAEKLQDMRNESMKGGGKERVIAQHQKGKLTARERIELLVDYESFVEIGSFVKHHSDKFGLENKKFLGDGVITGYGTIDGRKVFIYSQDFTILGGTIGKAHAQKISKILDLALKMGRPIIGIMDSGGARIQEGVDALDGLGDIFFRNVQASGIIPQISVILGTSAGGAAYSPALTDFIIMGGKNAFMFITGPQVVNSVTGENVSFSELGGPEIHSKISGISHRVTDTEEEALETVKKLLSYLPSNNVDDNPHSLEKYNVMDPQLFNNVLPESENVPYDMKTIIDLTVDQDTFFELFPNWAKNIIIGFGRIENQVVGIIANQPLELSGAIDSNASDKAARFIRFCDAFHINLITLVDVPGFIPGLKQERSGIIRHGAKLIYAYSEATVVKITVIIRKAYGGAYIVMNSKQLGADINLAWNSAQIAVMGAEGASKILFRNQLKKTEDPSSLLKDFTEKYKKEFSNPYQVAEKGQIDKVIFPHETRLEIIKSLKFFETKREQSPKRKHGVFPV
ncbi:MAG: acyl-CoA carboxylase subunit beta [Promethearchaeota archaeon]|jgi:acetyl-CoA carboxylase carboxyltransferase component